MKLVKTDWRNSLTDEAVTDLIRITLHSSDIKEFNPDQAIHQWRKASIRVGDQIKGFGRIRKTASKSRILTLPHLIQRLQQIVMNNWMMNWEILYQ
jgi:hypothetical protein